MGAASCAAALTSTPAPAGFVHSPEQQASELAEPHTEPAVQKRGWRSLEFGNLQGVQVIWIVGFYRITSARQQALDKEGSLIHRC